MGKMNDECNQHQDVVESEFARPPYISMEKGTNVF